MGRSSCLAVLCAVSLALATLSTWAGCNPNRANPPVAERFDIKGDTVLDKLTGLTWQRCSLGQKWKDKVGCVGIVDQVDFSAARDEEVDGWRLPRPAELRSILWYRCRNPAINDEAFPDMDPDSQWYWAFDGKIDQVVNFGDGNPPYCASPKCKGNAVRLVKRDMSGLDIHMDSTAPAPAAAASAADAASGAEDLIHLH